MPLLEMKHITKAFSGVYANEDVCLSVEPGEIHALLGENGAGKTTLMNILFGIYQADSGEIFYQGKKAHFKSPADAIEHGIGMVHQHFSLVNKMTVLDNIILGLKNGKAVLDREKAEKEISDFGERYGLPVKLEARAGSLSVGEQQRVEILKALYRNIDLLIMDEPTGVLTPQETDKFFGVLRRLKAEGYGIIIITHRLSEIMEISDRVTILRDGRAVKNLITADTAPRELSSLMMGKSLSPKRRERRKPLCQELLVLEKVSLSSKHGRKKALDDISLTVRKGEILGIAGVEGNGQKELAEVITGISRHTEGNILFDGEILDKLGVRERFNRGISYVSDDRHRDSLVMDMTVTENLILRNYNRPPFSRKHILNYKEAGSRAEKAVAEYGIKTSGKSGIKTSVRLMSGGNQQKVILSREISGEAKLVVASQPTRGLDMGAAEFVRDTLLRQKEEGKSVVLISADLDELMSLSDRIAVLFEGRIIGILGREEADANKIGLYMGGVAGKEISREQQ